MGGTVDEQLPQADARLEQTHGRERQAPLVHLLILRRPVVELVKAGEVADSVEVKPLPQAQVHVAGGCRQRVSDGLAAVQLHLPQGRVAGEEAQSEHPLSRLGAQPAVALHFDADVLQLRAVLEAGVTQRG